MRHAADRQRAEAARGVDDRVAERLPHRAAPAGVEGAHHLVAACWSAARRPARTGLGLLIPAKSIERSAMVVASSLSDVRPAWASRAELDAAAARQIARAARLPSCTAVTTSSPPFTGRRRRRRPADVRCGRWPGRRRCRPRGRAPRRRSRRGPAAPSFACPIATSAEVAGDAPARRPAARPRARRPSPRTNGLRHRALDQPHALLARVLQLVRVAGHRRPRCGGRAMVTSGTPRCGQLARRVDRGVAAADHDRAQPVAQRESGLGLQPLDPGHRAD